MVEALLTRVVLFASLVDNQVPASIGMSASPGYPHQVSNVLLLIRARTAENAC